MTDVLFQVPGCRLCGRCPLWADSTPPKPRATSSPAPQAHPQRPSVQGVHRGVGHEDRRFQHKMGALLSFLPLSLQVCFPGLVTFPSKESSGLGALDTGQQLILV